MSMVTTTTTSTTSGHTGIATKQNLSVLIKDANKRAKKGDDTRLKSLLQQLQEQAKETPNDVVIEKAIRKIDNKIAKAVKMTEDQFKMFSKSNRYSMSDLSKIANEEQSIENLFLMTKAVAQKKQPKKWAMANLITIPREKSPDKISQQFLVSSAPKKPHNVSKFWNNVLASGSRIIVSVLQPQEKDKIKSLPYWNTEQFGIQNITKLGEKILLEGTEGTQLIHRGFHVEKNNGEAYEIQQLHYDGWPDHKKAPDNQIFSQLIQEVHARDEGVHPVTVHCAGGIGRSSAFVFGYFLYKKMLEKSSRSQSEVKVLDENQRMEEESPIAPNEPKYNLLKYTHDAMTQRKKFGAKKHLANVAKGAIDAFEATQSKNVTQTESV